jgi:excinuclease ABC subunit A
MSEENIKIFGAKQHNLKNIDIKIPKNKLIVLTGPSGCGKSTIAMDILYGEGQRRFMESLPSYARQFLTVPERPDIDSAYGLCPSIAIDQKTIGNNLRSTVGTVTEIYDYLRVLYNTIGVPHCFKCKKELNSINAERLADIIFKSISNKKAIIAAELETKNKKNLILEVKLYIKKGFTRFLINNKKEIFRNDLSIHEIKLIENAKNIAIMLYSFSDSYNEHSLIVNAIKESFKITNGRCLAIIDDKIYEYSDSLFCYDCKYSFPRHDSRLFAFNVPIGACIFCKGIGIIEKFDKQKDDDLKITYKNCPECDGKRLNKIALLVKIKGKDIVQISDLPINKLKNELLFIKNDLDDAKKDITRKLFQEIESRIEFLINVGVGYLSISRCSSTLSGGESQRIRLATQIGSALSGVLYVLDEPSIGLHQSDNDKLIKTMKDLRDIGNTIVVVEHDMDTMLNADYIIDLGPKAGQYGGEIVAEGTPKEIIENNNSLTGQFLSGKKNVYNNEKAKRFSNEFIILKDANKNNLKNLTVKFPTEVLCCISGVSGSGKSTLLLDEFSEELKKKLITKKESRISLNVENIKYIVEITQKPIGRTPRSNAATYLGIFDKIRELYSSLSESQILGYKQGEFSFNVGKGRCSKCFGRGENIISMAPLPEVTIQCEECIGTGYSRSILDIKFKNKNISEILQMTVGEARDFFASHLSIFRKLNSLYAVGLDYITLGQHSNTFSGGESQRIKLADELSKRGNKTIYILDEPTTGLHFQDIQKLLNIFDKLIEKGNTIYVIEHNIDVLKASDYIIDLGPVGGQDGGYIIYNGRTDEIKNCKESITAKYI